MSHLVFLTATGGLLAAVLWLGADKADRLTHALLRPALMSLLGLLLLVSLDGAVRWPYALSGGAALVGLWESYIGVYHMLEAPVRRTGPLAQVRISAAWLISTLANLMLINLSANLAYPNTFQWRDLPATPLDIAYFTLLTFASGGYGDVLPATPLGKALVMLTSLSGLVYATILFAALFQRLRED